MLGPDSPRIDIPLLAPPDNPRILKLVLPTGLLLLTLLLPFLLLTLLVLLLLLAVKNPAGRVERLLDANASSFLPRLTDLVITILEGSAALLTRLGNEAVEIDFFVTNYPHSKKKIILLSYILQLDE